MGRWFAECITSLMGQTSRDFELLVVDDGDATTTAHYLAENFDGSCRVLEGPGQGLAAALAMGVEEARSEIILRIDQDDLCHADRVAMQVSFMNLNPPVVAAGSWASIVDSVGNRIGAFHTPLCDPGISLQMTIGCPFVHPSMALRRSAVLAVGNYRAPHHGPYPEDYDLWSRLIRIGPMANLPMELITYRQTANSSSSTSWNAIAAESGRIASENMAAWLGRPVTSAETKLITFFSRRERRLTMGEAVALLRLILHARIRAGLRAVPRGFPFRLYVRPLVWLLRRPSGGINFE